ncbi:beta-N-acetylhexosaminidase [Erythrobacteraceae bacterium CFH 75059]|uniref:beta-N-acetylhexosaminidase n=1 Tax=Qipengyuania thermophila TaxID=2509361 RepID=UPI001021CA86|nr:beta-N-acetylhexosaminidase [Qipengyuania thermophila]TCD06210.1 beta-N-acetylhexosaminidase [Erythrobacteraceae bacterium CFH 75059]
MTPAIFGIAGPQLSADETALFREADPVGYILFQRNCVDRDQVRRLTDTLRSLHGRDTLFIGIDQEGGRVARMKPPHWAAYPSGEMFARLFDLAPASAIEAIRANAQAIGLALAEAGVTVNFHAPLDLRQADADSVIGDRALGSDARQVAALGRAMIAGFARAGVAGCLKHMPGHGRAAVDSHKALPVVTASADTLEQDIAPFRALAATPIGMTAHIVYTAWDADRCATLSRPVIEEVIRGAIGFDGLLLTDDIDMEALDGPIAARGAAALAAGCDVVLNCWARLSDMHALADTLPRLTAAAEQRLARALAADGAQDLSPQEGAALHDELVEKRDALFAAAGLPLG